MVTSLKSSSFSGTVTSAGGLFFHMPDPNQRSEDHLPPRHNPPLPWHRLGPRSQAVDLNVKQVIQNRGPTTASAATLAYINKLPGFINKGSSRLR